MRFDHGDLSLWDGTTATPAPGETVPAGAEIAITVGVHPTDKGDAT